MMKTRLALLLALVLLGVPPAPQAQPTGPVWRIGVLMFDRACRAS
jgi:hypothetical protein